MSIKGNLRFLYTQLKGFKSKDKIVVIESDDWGSEYVPSLKVRQYLKDRGIAMDGNAHLKVDTLEKAEDMYALYETLQYIIKKYPDKKPSVTCNFIMTNPDYKKIKSTGYEKYYYEPFTTTYLAKNENDNTWESVQEGLKENLIKAQFHGREHINITEWFKLLKEGHKEFTEAFKVGCYAINSNTLGRKRDNLLSAFDFYEEDSKKFILESIEEGMDMFQNLFQYNSISAVAPRYVWNDDVEKVLNKKGVSSIQTSINQLVPNINGYQKALHYTGEKGNNDIFYTVRNAHFEPSYSKTTDWVKQVMSKAKIAFAMGTPLIISTHRLNFVSGLDEENRSRNLSLLKELLEQLIKDYPDVTFLNSIELATIINNKHNL